MWSKYTKCRYMWDSQVLCIWRQRRQREERCIRAVHSDSPVERHVRKPIIVVIQVCCGRGCVWTAGGQRRRGNSNKSAWFTICWLWSWWRFGDRRIFRWPTRAICKSKEIRAIDVPRGMHLTANRNSKRTPSDELTEFVFSLFFTVVRCKKCHALVRTRHQEYQHSRLHKPLHCLSCMESTHLRLQMKWKLK